jgi:hypothetical protein
MDAAQTIAPAPLDPDATMQRLSALLEGDQNLTGALESALLDIGLEAACSPSFIDHCRRRREHRLVLLLATLAVDHGSDPRSAQLLLDLYRSAHQRRLVGSLEVAEPDGVLPRAVRAWWHGKLDPQVASAGRGPLAGLSSSSPLHEQVLAVEFLLDHDRVAAAAQLLRELQGLGLPANSALRLLKAVNARSRSMDLSGAPLREWIACLQILHDALLGWPQGGELCDHLALRIGRLWLRARDARQARHWGSLVRAPRMRLQSMHHDVFAYSLQQDFLSANRVMDRLLQQLLQAPQEWVSQDYRAPTGNSQRQRDFNELPAATVLADLHRVLEPTGMIPFLAWGTLLGYARCGDFLSHDKDIDVGLLGGERSYEAVALLSASGVFSVDLGGLELDRIDCLPLRHRATGLALDVFFFHQHEQGLRTGVRVDMGFNERFVFPAFGLKAAQFAGVQTWVPDDLDRHLAAAYGPWRKPDPGFQTLVESPAIMEPGSGAHLLIARVTLLHALAKQSGSLGRRMLQVLERHTLTPHALPAPLARRLLQRFDRYTALDPQVAVR